MATHLFVHAQNPKSHDLAAIKGKQMTKTSHFCHDSSTSNVQKLVPAVLSAGLRQILQ